MEWKKTADAVFFHTIISGDQIRDPYSFPHKDKTDDDFDQICGLYSGKDHQDRQGAAAGKKKSLN